MLVDCGGVRFGCVACLGLLVTSRDSYVWLFLWVVWLVVCLLLVFVYVYVCGIS